MLETFRRIFLPLMAPAIFYSALMVGMARGARPDLPLVMNTGNSEVVATLIFNLQTNGEQNAAAAVAFYMIFVLSILALVARRMTGMQEIRGHDVVRREGWLSRLSGWIGELARMTRSEGWNTAVERIRNEPRTCL